MSKPPKVGSDVTSIKLKNHLGCRRVAKVLGPKYLKPLSRKRGRAQKYRVKRALPNRVAYVELRNVHFATTVGDLLSGACSEAESVKEELQEWYENMPENLQDGDVGERLQSAIYELDCVDGTWDEPCAPMAKIPVVYLPGRNVNSRPRRLSESHDMLRAVEEALLAPGLKLPADVHPEHRELCSAIEEVCDTLGGVDVPGMYG